MKRNMEIPDRHLLRVALNLYSISLERTPVFGGEIDQIEKGIFKGDNLLLDFCLCFKKLFNQHDDKSFNSLVNRICENTNRRLLFFKKCCETEIEQAKKYGIPLMFYWKDYLIYRKTNNYEKLFEKALNISKTLLKEKPQYTIEQIEVFLSRIIDSGGFVFSNITKIVLYGSLAKGTNKSYSDIDLLIIFKNDDPLNPLVIKVFIDSFKSATGQLPDCNYIYAGQKSRFIDWISSYGVEVFCK